MWAIVSFTPPSSTPALPTPPPTSPSRSPTSCLAPHLSGHPVRRATLPGSSSSSGATGHQRHACVWAKTGADNEGDMGGSGGTMKSFGIRDHDDWAMGQASDGSRTMRATTVTGPGQPRWTSPCASVRPATASGATHHGPTWAQARPTGAGYEGSRWTTSGGRRARFRSPSKPAWPSNKDPSRRGHHVVNWYNNQRTTKKGPQGQTARQPE